MRIKMLLSIILAFQANSAMGLLIEDCTFIGQVLKVEERTVDKKAVMKVMSVEPRSHLSPTDCKSFLDQQHSFSFDSKKNKIHKGSFVKIRYERSDGRPYERWAIVETSN